MKKTLLILAGLAVLLVAALAGAVYYLLNSVEVEQNRSKTAAARAVRHAKPPVEAETIETVNEAQNENQEVA